VVLRAGAAPDESELLSYCEQRLGQFKTPTRIYLTSDLPKVQRKVQRLRLREDASSRAFGRLTGERPAPHDGWQVSDSSIEQLIAESWAAVLSATRIEADSNFFALGGHSLLLSNVFAPSRDNSGGALAIRFLREHNGGAAGCAGPETIAQRESYDGPRRFRFVRAPRERALQNVSSSITHP